MLEEPRAGALPEARMEGQLAGLQEVLGEVAPARRTVLNSGNTREASETQMLRALDEHPDERRIAVICFNDDAALGALPGRSPAWS